MSSHYENNKEIYKARAKARDLAIRSYLIEKKNVPCMDCKIKYPHYVMDFDHRPETNKTITPSQMARMKWSFERIDKELAGCDIVCSNCHRERTHSRRQYYGDER